jgi:Ca2+-dependent lipid-binding protein
MTNSGGTLHILLVSGQMKSGDIFGKGDPYVKFRFDDQVRTSTVKKNHVDPKWNEGKN